MTLHPARWQSFVDCVRDRAQHQPDRLALAGLVGLQTVGERLSYARLDLRARAVAARLQQRCAPGDRVLLVMGNTPDYVVGFLACGYAGCVAVNLLQPRRAKHMRRLVHIARDCDAQALLTSGSGAERIAGWLADLPEMGAVAMERVDHIADDEADGYRARRPSGGLCALQYTSGSTGDPRGVMIGHQNLMAHSADTERTFGFTAEDRGVSWLPLFHDLGLVLGVLQPIYSGFPVFLGDPMAFVKHPDRWLRMLSAQQATYTAGPNFAFDLVLDSTPAATLDGVDLSSVTRIMDCAEPLRARTVEAFTRRFAPLGLRPEAFCTGYGLAEATLVVSTSPAEGTPVMRAVDAEALSARRVEPAREGRRQTRLVGSGRVGVGVDVAIVDPDSGRRLAADRVGEVWVASRGMALGYWNRPAQTAATFGGRLADDDRGWLRTGDLGFVDDGELYITGRIKDVIIVNGANRAPQDIEESAERAHAAVRPNFVAAFADAHGDREHLVVVAELRGDVEDDHETILQRIVRRITSDHAVPVDEAYLAHRGQVPKTTSGKIRRSTCRALLRAGELKVHAAWQARR